MKHIADQTGAADDDGMTTSLPAVFRRVGDQLRLLYEIGYASTHGRSEQGFRKLTVRCLRPDSAVRAKSGYYVH